MKDCLCGYNYGEIVMIEQGNKTLILCLECRRLLKCRDCDGHHPYWRMRKRGCPNRRHCCC